MNEVITPSGCRWCGIPERGHGDRWALGRGVHVYDAPEQWQIKARMLQRRAAARQQQPILATAGSPDENGNRL